MNKASCLLFFQGGRKNIFFILITMLSAASYISEGTEETITFSATHIQNVESNLQQTPIVRKENILRTAEIHMLGIWEKTSAWSLVELSENVTYEETCKEDRVDNCRNGN